MQFMGVMAALIEENDLNEWHNAIFCLTFMVMEMRYVFSKITRTTQKLIAIQTSVQKLAKHNPSCQNIIETIKIHYLSCHWHYLQFEKIEFDIWYMRKIKHRNEQKLKSQLKNAVAWAKLCYDSWYKWWRNFVCVRALPNVKLNWHSLKTNMAFVCWKLYWIKFPQQILLHTLIRQTQNACAKDSNNQDVMQ